MANISTYFPSGGSGASGGGIEGTNKFTIKAGSSSIPAGWPVSYTLGDKTIEKTQGDPNSHVLPTSHGGVNGHGIIQDPDVFNCSNHCYCCYLHCATSACSAYDVTMRLGPLNWFRLSKSGLMAFKNKACADANNCTDGLAIPCYGMQNICYDENNLCLTVLNTGFVVECACTNSNTTVDCSSFCWCQTPSVPFHSYTSVESSKCCFSGGSCCCICCFQANPRPGFPFMVGNLRCCSQIGGSNSQCRVVSQATKNPYEAITGTMVFKSCDCAYWYVAMPVLRKATVNTTGNCCAFLGKKCYMHPRTMCPGGQRNGMMLWKFTKCSGKDELCTNPSITCDLLHGCWGLGNLTKNGNLMYGVKSKAVSSICANCDCLCVLLACEFFFVEEMDGNVCLNPTAGCIASTNREFNFQFCNTSSNSNCGSICSEGERKLWPLTEDANGWVLWTEPVQHVYFRKGNNGRAEKKHCASFMRVGAFKPTGQGAGVMSANIVCMCHNAATDGQFCLGLYNGVTGACSGVFTRCASLERHFAGDCAAGQNFGDYMVMQDDHPVLVKAHSMQSDGGIPKCFFCCSNSGVRNLCYGFLPQGAVHTGCYDSGESKQFLILYPFWIGAEWTNCQTRICCGSNFLGGENVCFKFCVNNSNNCIYLTGCTGSVTNITCFNTTSCSSHGFSKQTCIMPGDLFKHVEKNLRASFVETMLYELRPRPVTTHNQAGYYVTYCGLRMNGDVCIPNHVLKCQDFACYNCSESRGINCCMRTIASIFAWPASVYLNTMSLCPQNYSFLSCQCIEVCFSSKCQTCASNNFNISYNCTSPTTTIRQNFPSVSGGNPGVLGRGDQECCMCVGSPIFPYVYICEDSCLCHQDAFCVYTRCRATGAVTACSLGCYFGTLSFMPQGADVVGAGCHIIFWNCTCADGNPRYAVATQAAQNNSATWLGFASEAGNAGDAISVATLNSGTAPLHACLGGCCFLGNVGGTCCFRLQCPVATIQNSTCPAILCCFAITNPQVVCNESKVMGAYRSCVCISFNPADNCCKLYITPRVDVC